jgi:hypothetical protein
MQAAEQRARDKKSCASGALAQREAEKAAKASVESQVIDLTLDDDMDNDIYWDPDEDIITTKEASGCGETSAVETPKGWACIACTFINPPTASRCDMCNSAKPRISSTQPVVALPSNPTSVKSRLPFPSVITHPDWSCSKCTLDNSHDFWSCAACGTVKVQS